MSPALNGERAEAKAEEGEEEGAEGVSPALNGERAEAKAEEEEEEGPEGGGEAAGIVPFRVEF